MTTIILLFLFLYLGQLLIHEHCKGMRLQPGLTFEKQWNEIIFIFFLPIPLLIWRGEWHSPEFMLNHSQHGFHLHTLQICFEFRINYPFIRKSPIGEQEYIHGPKK